MRLPGDRLCRLIRRDAKNRSARLLKMFVGRAAGVEGAEQVDVDDGLEAIGRHAGDRGREIARRGTEQNVDGTKLFVGSLQRRGQFVVIADVEGRGCGMAPAFTNCRGSRIQLFLLPSREHGLCSMLCKSLGDTLSDAAASAGNKRDLALKQTFAKYAGHEATRISELPVIRDQIEWRRLLSHGPQKAGDLATMMRPVVHDMQHDLPQWCLVG